ncbi:MAG TPA: hypothetical protein VGB90_06685, partial [Alphaproteobacteria bacterium]
SGAAFPNIGALIVISAPAFLAIWLLRIISRQLHANIAEMHDARDRVVMAQTFLALLDHGKVTPEDRVLILHSLFRPSTIGGADDSTPPHWFELLMERVKSPRSSAG